MHHAFKLEDAEYSVELSRARQGYRLHLHGSEIPIDLVSNEDGSAWLHVAGQRERVWIAQRGDEVWVHLRGEAHCLRYEHPLQRLAQAQAGGGDVIAAPMPGSIVAIHVEPGATVSTGQALLVMESMKMETTISAPANGVVEAVHFAVGQTFDRDAVLVSMAALED